MEGNYVTTGDLALIEQRRGYDGYHKGNATATTGVALGAGLGGAALVGVFLTAWALNQASKARAKAAENLAQANTNYINQMAGFVQAERVSRAIALEAEGKSRAIRLNAEAEKDAAIMRAEATKAAMQLIAEAEAEYVAKLAQTIGAEGATRALLNRQALDGYKTISANPADKVFIPSDMPGVLNI